ncbi:uncharacterized protein LOC111080544 isoform X2 [Drosophila obscura]|uniref:uncharacterized protein LOC111080544 isoform X2 n=1 Tax=Drosophila obscura TaxID=7282 RepID=UPI001BB2513F|nr:uncharacterized protein LOC111080544 isoform X2 [Drosophila obscura]
MGAKASKIEGEYLPDTPTLNKLRLGSCKAENLEMTTPIKDSNALLDPRSPNGCRTPLNPEQQAQPVRTADHPTSAPTENAFSQLRKRLLKGFSLNDPRSPQLNRTPLILDEVRSLNLDDTFADLFVDTRAPARPTAEMPAANSIDSPYQSLSPASAEPGDVSCDSFGTPPQTHHNNSSLEIVSLPYDEEETMPCTAELPGTPPAQGHYDPRSPSIGVERTPIMFCDDEEEEARESEMLEQILETLTLNLSAESSMASFASAGTDTNLEEPQIPGTSERQPANKHLDRVRLGNKRRVAPRKPARASKTKIYMDKESSPSGASTPKTTPQATPKRTPLSCVKNRPHLRSRSVERELRKSQLPLHSFDDQLNHSERFNGSSLRRLMSGTDSQIGAMY